MTLERLRDTDPPNELIKIKSIDIQFVWTSGFFDGPISGMLEYKNELFWYEMTQENHDWIEGSWYRRYGIIKLTREQLNKELVVHEDFQKYVGTKWDEKLLKSPPKFVKGQQKRFYDKHSEHTNSMPFEKNELIGWMEK